MNENWMDIFFEQLGEPQILSSVQDEPDDPIQERGMWHLSVNGKDMVVAAYRYPGKPWRNRMFFNADMIFDLSKAKNKPLVF